MSFRLLRGRGTGLAAVTLGLALLVTPLALAGNDRGDPVEIELRNRSAGETGLVTASDEYSLRLSNTKEGGGGGAVYGCRAPDAAPRRDLACLYADNLRGGKAFLFRSRDGDSVGHFDIGDPANPPFTTNARGLVQNLNAEMVGGLTAQQLIARAPAESRPGATGPQGPKGDTGATGPRGPSNGFAAQGGGQADPLGPGSEEVVTLSLPAGSFMVTAKVGLESDAAGARQVSCELFSNSQGEIDNSDMGIGPDGVTDLDVMSLVGATTSDIPAEVSVTCIHTASGGEIKARDVRINAIQVATLTGL